MPKMRFITLSFLLGMLALALYAIPSPRLVPPELQQLQYMPREYEAVRADSATGFDVQKYELTIAITQNPNYINGSVRATVLAEEALSSISYELVGLSVSSVLVNDAPASYTHSGGMININLNIAAGQSFTTTVNYSGNPVLTPNVYHIGMIFSANSIFTISDPDAARYWWPCYDHPWDKAIVDLHVTMRSDWKVAANGLRESIVNNGNGTSTTHWLGQHPMTTYLVCITAGPYVEIDQTAMNGTLPIKNFVLQSQYNNALNDLAQMPAMIDYFSQVFGSYPFEKYGNAVVSMSTYGAMEHQTMTTLGNYIINGQGTYEIVVAHELAHQWYGNAVSFLTFKDVWLSEGFATYSEQIWTDKRLGWASAVEYVRSSFHEYYKNWENSYGQTPAIYDPAFNSYFTPPSYEKAASVLHMLRLKLGDAQFFQLLQEWFTTYRDGNVITAEFRAMAENISGQSLQQFFDQWIFGRGIPSLEYSAWHHPTDPRGNIKILAKTTSPTATQFWIDVPMRMPGSTADSLLVMASPAGQANYYDVGFIEGDDPCGATIQSNFNHWTLLRGNNYSRPHINQCLASNAAVMLSWDAFAVPGVAGYNLYRKSPQDETWQRVNQAVITGLNYTDQGLQNGVHYRYLVRAVDAEGYQSFDSDQAEAIPQGFSFAQDLLVVDETRNGTGTNINPTDVMVDDFYEDALGTYNYVHWDVDTQGMPGLDTLGDFKVVLWHSDDFNQIQIVDALDTLGGYLLGGGKLVISGWKTPSAFTPGFLESFLPGISLLYDNAAGLISAQSTEYPVLNVDPAKLSPTWNGMLPMVYTFTGASEVLYTAQMSATSNGADNALAIKSGNLVIFGAPLYFMLADGVNAMLPQLVAELLAPVDADDTVVVPLMPHIRAYPNPFRSSTTLEYVLPKAGDYSISIYNIRGQLVRRFRDNAPVMGRLEKSFDGLDQGGKSLPSGIYTIKINWQGGILVHRISLIK